MAAQIYYDNDADLSLLKDKTIATVTARKGTLRLRTCVTAEWLLVNDPEVQIMIWR